MKTTDSLIYGLNKETLVQLDFYLLSENTLDKNNRNILWEWGNFNFCCGLLWSMFINKHLIAQTIIPNSK